MGGERKPKLSAERQVAFLAERGVKFDVVNKDKACEFLTKHTYFYKLKSYCVNYAKDESDRYVDLDFAYLIDLSTIDMHLRRFVNTLTLNVEHILKTKLLADFNESPFDGYDIVDSFLNCKQGEKALKYIKGRQSSSADYLPKLPSDLKNLPIWHFVEIVQFGHLLVFCDHFYDRLQTSSNKESPICVSLKLAREQYFSVKHALYNVKCLRNAAAHNNCVLLLNRNNATMQQNAFDFLYLEVFQRRNGRKIKEFLKCRATNDLTSSLWVFDKLCKSAKMKRRSFVELKRMLRGRFARNRDYYRNNSLIRNKYQFMLSVANYFYKQSVS
ncbi:MAG: Abi family protein [Helicobacteraceae bacterium]|nr:Abi family protein [Helicobacteraceae bacterium]